jgi:pimeloyl-ACP methyl ester carboxylesterase
MSENLPVILLPGMGADRRLFQKQIAVFESLVTPDWIPLQRGDTLVSYAKRMAPVVDPGGPCFIGGASFGGMVALEMSRYLDAKACFLIGSIRSSDELPRRARVLKSLAHVIPNVATGLPGGFTRMLLAVGGRFMRPNTRSVFRQFSAADGHFMRWAALAVAKWRPPAEPPTAPVFQIHGDRDRMLPHKLTHPDVLVHGAGHLLSVTHGDEVNEFLRTRMEQCEPVKP